MIRLLASVLKENGDKPVLQSGGRGMELTGKQLLWEIGRSCGFWKRFFPDSGHHIGILAENSADWLIQFFGIIASGNLAVAYGVNDSDDEIRRRIRCSDTEVMLCDDGMLPEYEAEQFGIPALEMSRAYVKEAEDFAVRGEEEEVMLLFSSGTGGRSKIVPLTNGNLLAFASCLRGSSGSHEKPESGKSEDAVLIPVPLYHISGIFNSYYELLKGNTLIISGLSLLTFPAPIILALLLNEVRSQTYKKLVQTAVYLPHFISWAIVASLAFLLLSEQQGVINKIIVSMGGEAIDFLFRKSWTYPIIVIESVWKGVGWGSIVYLAAISGIDQELYEAARIDGANKIQQMVKITLPCIMPTVVTMLILKMGSIISVDFEQILLLSNAMNRSQTEVFELYIYNYGIASGSTQYSYTTAIGMFKSVVNTAMVVLTNWIVSRKGYNSIL